MYSFFCHITITRQHDMLYRLISIVHIITFFLLLYIFIHYYNILNNSACVTKVLRPPTNILCFLYLTYFIPCNINYTQTCTYITYHVFHFQCTCHMHYFSFMSLHHIPIALQSCASLTAILYILSFLSPTHSISLRLQWAF